jgi:hypothetical protein
MVVRKGMLGKVCVDPGPVVTVVRIVSAHMGMNKRRGECGGLEGNRQPDRDQSPQHSGIIGPGSGQVKASAPFAHVMTPSRILDLRIRFDRKGSI